MAGEHVSRAHAGTRHVSHGEHAPLSRSASRSLPRSLTPALRFSLSTSLSFSHTIFLVLSCFFSSPPFLLFIKLKCISFSLALSPILYLPISSFSCRRICATVSFFNSLLYLAVLFSPVSIASSLCRALRFVPLLRFYTRHTVVSVSSSSLVSSPSFPLGHSPTQRTVCLPPYPFSLLPRAIS